MIAVPLARELYGPSAVEVNEKLSGFARAVIMAKKEMYLLWVVNNARNVLGRLAFSARWVQLLLLVALGFFLLRVLLQAWVETEDWMLADQPIDSSGKSILTGVWVITLLFMAGKIAINALIEFPLRRYAYATAVLLPCPLCGAIYYEYLRCRLCWRRSRQSS
jgi:hypothetical protein